MSIACLNPLCPKCNAQTQLQTGPFGPHYGKYICPQCDKFCGWAPTPREARPDVRSGTLFGCPDCQDFDFSIKLANSGNGGDLVCGTCGYYVAYIPPQKLSRLLPENPL